MNIEHYRLLEKFLDGKCTVVEKQIVRELLDTEGGRSTLADIMAERDEENSLIYMSDKSENPSERVLRLRSEVHRRIKVAEKKPQAKVRSFHSFIAKAAIWVGTVCLIGIITYQSINSQSSDGSDSAISYVQKINESGQPVLYILPDSSELYLAAGSYVKYPKQFLSSERRIELVGEAFFDVQSDKSRPFIIETGEIRTQVLGTSFRVSAYRGENVEVAVATGKVSVHAASSDQYDRELAVLSAGARLIYDQVSKNVYRGPISEAALNGWKAGELVFVDERLEVIAKQLSRRYNVSISCDIQELADYRVSASFAPDENLEQILELLSGMGRFEYRKKNETEYELCN